MSDRLLDFVSTLPLKFRITGGLKPIQTLPRKKSFAVFRHVEEISKRHSLAKIRLWHLFVLVGAIAVFVWIHTERGIGIAEIEILKVSTWPRSNSSNSTETNSQMDELVVLEFKYINPDEFSNQNVLLFFKESTFIPLGKFKVGDLIRFRYRATPSLWLKRSDPNAIAYDRLGFDKSNIQEAITMVDYLPTNMSSSQQ